MSFPARFLHPLWLSPPKSPLFGGLGVCSSCRSVPLFGEDDWSQPEASQIENQGGHLGQADHDITHDVTITTLGKGEADAPMAAGLTAPNTALGAGARQARPALTQNGRACRDGSACARPQAPKTETVLADGSQRAQAPAQRQDGLGGEPLQAKNSDFSKLSGPTSANKFEILGQRINEEMGQEINEEMGQSNSGPSPLSPAHGAQPKSNDSSSCTHSPAMGARNPKMAHSPARTCSPSRVHLMRNPLHPCARGKRSPSRPACARAHHPQGNQASP